MNTAKVLGTGNWELKYILEHFGEITYAVFSPDGQYILTASEYDLEAKIWKAKNGKLLFRIKERMEGINTASFSSDGRYIFLFSWDEAEIWDMETKKLLYSLKEDEWEIHKEGYNTESKYYFTAFISETKKVWKLHKGHLIKIRGEELEQAHTPEISPDGHFIATIVTGENKVKIWKPSKVKLFQTIEKNKVCDYAVDFSPDGNYIITSAYRSSPKIWDAKSGKFLYQINTRPDVVDSATIFSGDEILISEYNDKMPRLFSERSYKFSPNSQYILTDSWNKTANVWEAKTGKLIHKLKGHTKAISSSAFSPDGQYILTSSWDGTAKLWETVSGKMVHSLKGHQDYNITAKFSPDGKLIVTISIDTAKVWDLAYGQLLFTLEGHKHQIKSMEFSKDGGYIVTTCGDAARVWEVASGELIRNFEGYNYGLGKVLLSPDNQKILINLAKF